jgi:hypothetical protein
MYKMTCDCKINLYLGILVSSINYIDWPDIAEILLKVVLKHPKNWQKITTDWNSETAHVTLIRCNTIDNVWWDLQNWRYCFLLITS